MCSVLDQAFTSVVDTLVANLSNKAELSSKGGTS